jgi:23S rRNA (cytidine1920-2'-O)/16S rRNA (cytidine1409-2'-O)-methyltransferase
VDKQRLDYLVCLHGLAESRERAQQLIAAGQVSVDGQVRDKPGARIASTARIEVAAGLPYASRGGLKLQAALHAFGVDVRGLVAADVGASTGGFTDCLLQHGAARVYAIDVGYGQLSWRLRQDPRVVVMERVNVRYLEGLPEPIDLASVDVSFISLKLVVPPIVPLLKPSGRLIALIKPQFEAGRRQVGKGGVVKDAAIHRAVLQDVLGWAVAHDLHVRGCMQSPLLGPAGNVEFLTHWTLRSDAQAPGVEAMIEACLPAAQGQCA